MGDIEKLLRDYGPAFGQALLVTWKLTALSFAGGFLLGVVLTVLRLLPIKPAKLFVQGYVEVFRNIPSPVLLIFVVFALPDLNVLIDYEPSVILTLSLVGSAFAADNLLSGINTIGVGQVEAARSLGMGLFSVIFRIVLPQALRSVVQPMTSLLIGILLSAALASLVPVPGRELTALVAKIANDTASGIAAFLIAASMYVASGLLISWAGAWLEKKARYVR
jgi:His/Glu/Gln/Arg/opine family amino acid ABC transporter permease subunit